jgi:organic hydroperoxide reductase OsmC/OhrA
MQSYLSKSIVMATAEASGTGESDSVHLVTIDWTRGKWAGAKGKYSREHVWHLAGGAKLKASDSPALVPKGFHDRAAVNPENMLVAAISSAHMLSWLNMAFGMGIEVVSYLDRAYGVMTEIAGGDVWISEVILQPRITFDPHYDVGAEVIEHIHQIANEHCFIARSVKAKVTIRPVEPVAKSTSTGVGSGA